MKNKIWVLLTIAGIVIAIMSCDDKDKDNGGTIEPTPDPVYCPDKGGNGHLGVGEDCIKDTGTCSGLQDYRTAAQKASFPKEINRYGKVSNYTAQELRNTADKIIAAFDLIIADANGEIETRDEILLEIAKLYVVKAANNYYTWNKTDFGADPSVEAPLIKGAMTAIPKGVLPEAAVASGVVAQLQSANGIRMANGKKSTERFPAERFPAVAGGNGKLPRADRAATGFELNRQLIARNNRNVKNQWRQAQV